MKKLFILLFTFLTPVIILSQDFEFPNSPYNNASNQVKSSAPFNRERWFYEQRMYPQNSIPEDAYSKALQQRETLRQQNGFYFAPNTVSWFNIGPTPGYYFNYGNISGRIVTIKVDPNNPSTVYIGAAYGGIWKSTNAGLNWVPKTDFEASMSSGALAIDPVNSNIVYYGTGEATYSGASYYGRGLLKSTNGGDNWVNIKSGLPTSTYFSRIVIKPGNTSYLLAALGTSGLYRSTDAGLTWSSAVSGKCDDVVYSPDGSKVYIIGQGSGYKISTDGGATFTAGSFPVSLGQRNHIAICKAVPTVLYVSVYTGSVVNVYKSTDAGASFTQISVGTDFAGGQAWYDFYMHVSPINPDVAFVGTIDVWRTTNGNTFTNVTNGYSNGNVHVDNHNMEFHPTNANIVYAVSDGGVWYSSDQGTTWVNRNAGLTITQFYRMTSDPNNAAHLAGGTQDNGTQQTFSTINWTAGFGGDGGEVCFQPNNSNYMLGETQNNGVQRSVNNGTSWTGATTGLTGSGAWVSPIVAHPDSVEIFYTARQNVFKTTNMGASWFAISGAISGTVSVMDISKSNPSFMYLASGSVLYKSTDRGYTFASAGTGLPNKTITSVYVHPDSNLVCLVTMSGFGGNKVFKTINGGVNWFSINGDLPDSPVNDGMFYYPGHATNVILAATDIGVFMTNNNGVNWIELANGLPNTVAMHLDYNAAANKLRIGTHGRGTWEMSGTLIGITNYSSIVPDKFFMSQNYPNPFNPSTKITFGIKEAGFVTLKVYDMLGREVSSLVNKDLKAGTYDVTFSGANLTSGIYFYRLTAGKFSETKRLSFIK
ncbi:MAG: T9SS type A sorting domain-containing protein [Ignavibacteria bacterium]|nr:T9SS type A sorting domain-containing protein [Ignavibacteria bacterium]